MNDGYRDELVTFCKGRGMSDEDIEQCLQIMVVIEDSCGLDDPDLLQELAFDLLSAAAEITSSLARKYEALHGRDRMRKIARGPRRRNQAPETELKLRGLARILQDDPNIKAGKILDHLDAEKRITFEDDDLELRLEGENIIVRDLSENPEVGSASIATGSLRKYLSDARNT